MLYFQQKQLYHFLSGDNKDKKYYNEGNITIDGYCTVPIISLQSASVHKKTCITKEKGTNC
jgi:hypothetical protein